MAKTSGRRLRVSELSEAKRHARLAARREYEKQRAMKKIQQEKEATRLVQEAAIQAFKHCTEGSVKAMKDELEKKVADYEKLIGLLKHSTEESFKAMEVCYTLKDELEKKVADYEMQNGKLLGEVKFLKQELAREEQEKTRLKKSVDTVVEDGLRATASCRCMCHKLPRLIN